MKRSRQVSTNTLIRRRDGWLRKLAEVGPMVRGSLCTAHKGNHVAHQLTVSVKGKTHTVYVPMDMVEEVKQWTKNHRRLQRILKEVSKLNMAIIHRHVPENQGDGRNTTRRRPNPRN